MKQPSESVLIQQDSVNGTEIYTAGDPSSDTILIQPVDENDRSGLAEECHAIQGKSFFLCAFLVHDWFQDLTPWEAPPVWGKDAFGDGAVSTLSFLLHQLIPSLSDKKLLPSGGTAPRYCLGGYSLAGFFSLWAAYQTDFFSGIAAVSPSVWYPDWTSYIHTHTIRTPSLYLSLGTSEERTRNPVMATVGDCIRQQKERMDEEILSHVLPLKDCTLEWNPGNHFQNSPLRTARGFSWLLSKIQGRQP